jgi:hypothetical protein
MVIAQFRGSTVSGRKLFRLNNSILQVMGDECDDVNIFFLGSRIDR